LSGQTFRRGGWKSLHTMQGLFRLHRRLAGEWTERRIGSAGAGVPDRLPAPWNDRLKL